jgi:hypothetical protein
MAPRIRDWSQIVSDLTGQDLFVSRLPNGKPMTDANINSSLDAVGQGHSAGVDYLRESGDPHDDVAIGLAARNGILVANQTGERIWLGIIPQMTRQFEVRAFHLGFREAIVSHLWKAADHVAG